MFKQRPIIQMIDSNQRVARFEPISWKPIWQLLDKIEQVDILSTPEGRNGATDDVNADINGQVTPGL